VVTDGRGASGLDSARGDVDADAEGETVADVVPTVERGFKSICENKHQ
jgi:hypothetical protein